MKKKERDYGLTYVGPYASIGLSQIYTDTHGKEGAVIFSALEEVAAHASILISKQGEDVETKFQELFWLWKRDVAYQSSLEVMMLNENYQRIIGLGPDVVPVILRELKREPAFLFPALAAVTRENPVPADHEGDVARMAEDWIQWGREKGFC